jgi:hypothetical protein
MTQELSAADDRFPLCLNDIDGFENIIARMPAPAECRDNGLGADAPVLVMRRSGGQEQLYRADQVTLTIDPGPPAAEADLCGAARYALDCILENLGNVLSDIARLDAAMSGPARNLIKIADELRSRRTGEPSTDTGDLELPGSVRHWHDDLLHDHHGGDAVHEHRRTGMKERRRLRRPGSALIVIIAMLCTAAIVAAALG